MDDIDYDKKQRQMATEYILGPLYDPEPSQVFASRAAVCKTLPPTPPASASPTRPHFFSRHSRNETKDEQDPEDQTLFRRILSRSNSVNSKPQSPPPKPGHGQLTTLERKKSLHTSKPPQTHWNQGTILARANSVATSRPTIHAGNTVPYRTTGRRRGSSLAEHHPQNRYSPPVEPATAEYQSRERDTPSRRGVTLRDPGPVDIPQRPADKPAQTGTNISITMPRRAGSLRERYPGDMSHRPLAIIRQEHRAADRAPHLHTHRRQQPSDTIDSLDQAGPIPEVAYHHSGPFDPVMKSRNTNKRYSPVEAVKDTNNEALKATPVEFLRDSIDKHVPLQGTAIVPPGEHDMTGRKIDYEEGTDLMREKDAPGGAYKRWDHISYLDEDLKGKGEPSYTIEKESKGKEISRKPLPPSKDAYEMQPRTVTGSHKNGSANVRHRSVSNAAESPLASTPGASNPFSDSYAANDDLRRSNTTGRSLTASLKRRLGSFRRKKVSEERVY